MHMCVTGQSHIWLLIADRGEMSSRAEEMGVFSGLIESRRWVEDVLLFILGSIDSKSFFSALSGVEHMAMNAV